MSNNKMKFNPHSVIFREGDDASKVMIITSGEVICFKSSKGKLIPILKASNGDIIGESSMLENAPYTYSAISRTNVELIEILAKDMHEVLKVSPGWLTNLTATLVARFNNTANLIATNRVMHPSILTEEEFPIEKELDYKKLLGQ